MLPRMMQKTHAAMSARLCGVPRELVGGRAVVELALTDEMRADERGLVHGGFVFGLADYAAMLAINEPTVVLGSAEVRFVAPVVVGDLLRATARLSRRDGRKHVVDVEVASERGVAFRGSFVCFVPDRHVLDAQRTGEGP